MPDSNVPGNGKQLAVHEYQLKAILQEVREINEKLDRVLPIVAVHEAKLSGLEAWRGWASGVGGTLLLTLIGLVLAHLIR